MENYNEYRLPLFRPPLLHIIPSKYDIQVTREKQRNKNVCNNGNYSGRWKDGLWIPFDCDFKTNLIETKQYQSCIKDKFDNSIVLIGEFLFFQFLMFYSKSTT
jgi:hypothetical protein